eukprot:CAMPEP_0180098110 /NCGR_PEP_ID=MMETSP0985-20121206/27577_1 /TAXON_ID=483367 /ORGANISM="non described non described, Strain CCMP 2436" /LENGTH=145 /DNA_ID=CAMNT_0022033531 /DNA_START=447 /DNA_END=881 /DNA_ORIENTATION=+
MREGAVAAQVGGADLSARVVLEVSPLDVCAAVVKGVDQLVDHRRLDERSGVLHVLLAEDHAPVAVVPALTVLLAVLAREERPVDCAPRALQAPMSVFTAALVAKARSIIRWHAMSSSTLATANLVGKGSAAKFSALRLGALGGAS